MIETEEAGRNAEKAFEDKTIDGATHAVSSESKGYQALTAHGLASEPGRTPVLLKRETSHRRRTCGHTDVAGDFCTSFARL
ncbi:MAG: hypothetical protein HYU36_24005 [Planctomycetes bacterium]|nr:hypothetical protein [Planctomycetota bacterium]